MRIAWVALLGVVGACGGSHPSGSAGAASITVPAPTVAPTNPAPATFVTTTSDTRTGRIVDVREGLNKAAVFKAMSDFLTQKYSVDVSDPRAGFLMTPWINATRNGAPDLHYRTRIIIRVIGDDAKQVAIRSEANWQRGDEWDVGYDTQMLEDTVIEVRTRIGKKT
jgi:hypothetical protein